jgi:hypothetical protein
MALAPPLGGDEVCHAILKHIWQRGATSTVKNTFIAGFLGGVKNQGSAMDSTAAIKPIFAIFWDSDGVGQVIPTKAYFRKVWI